ncbi:DUF6221 family protein [Streptomyces sp. NBC_00448]|uniref:DUF6221 family protein n=1 Tax=Streptomyces sp. NBC_00448 TaxID=2903652 RepID=UPI002E1CFB58
MDTGKVPAAVPAADQARAVKESKPRPAAGRRGALRGRNVSGPAHRPEGNSVIEELTAFVRARMTEDLTYAWGGAVAGGQWTAEGPRLVVDSGAAFEMAAPLAAHTAHHDPARVVRAVAAKQAIVAKCERHLAQGAPGLDARDSELFVAQILVALAAEWASHPDYRAEWNGSPAGGA